MDLLAVATLGVAIFTAVLALATRTLARSAATDQQSQWRPVIIPADQTVDERTQGELVIQLRNVGRGPALGLHGELRRGDAPYAASVPGQENIAAPDDRLWIRFGLPDPPAPRASVIRAWLSYYDVAEQWHRTEILISARAENDPRPLRIARTHVEETGRNLTAGQGSRRAAQLAAQRQRRPWMRAWSRIRGVLGHRPMS
jgi:hypothetical protein